MALEDNIKNDLNEIAQRLYGLYQKYGCENELPAYNDLVSKLGIVEPEVRNAIYEEVNRRLIYPLSVKEVLQDEKKDYFLSAPEEFLGLLAMSGVCYAAKTATEEDKLGLVFKAKLLYGAFLGIPQAVKEAFLTQKEEKAEKIIEQHNEEAKKLFEAFKNNIKYFVK